MHICFSINLCFLDYTVCQVLTYAWNDNFINKGHHAHQCLVIHNSFDYGGT